ncbi:hypothetical protein BC937DRAFT_94962 [Endogone sp. FLAS-F59071]|nr:hypothetical protein BC937DRAFT_94962 [Endogone sp. FLAS-F59071]|eukprot:RUS20550.1 hypothetical protein BC937DRAFT_94962 [Endogone sp. FLAS-F59071]
MSIRRDDRLPESLPKELLFEERALRRYVQEIDNEELRTSIDYHLTSLLDKYVKLHIDVYEELHQVKTQLDIYSTKYDDLVASMAIPGTNPFAYPDRAPLSPPMSIKPDTNDYPYIDGQREDVNDVLLQNIIDQLTISSPSRQPSVSKALPPLPNIDNLQPQQQANDYFVTLTSQVQIPAENPSRTQPSSPSVVSTYSQEQEPPPNFPASILAAHPQPISVTHPGGSHSGHSRQEDTGSLSSDSTISKHSSAGYEKPTVSKHSSPGYEKPATYQGNAQQPPPMPEATATLTAGPPVRRLSYWSMPDSLRSDNSWHRGSWASEDSGRSNIQMALDDTSSTISGYTGNRQQPPPSSELYAFPNANTMAGQQRSTAESPSLERQQRERDRQRSFTSQPMQPYRQMTSPSLERQVLSRQYTQSQSPQLHSQPLPTLERQQTRPTSQDSQGSQSSSPTTSNPQTPRTPTLGPRSIPPPTPPHELQPDNSLTSPTSAGFSPLARTTTTRSVASIASTSTGMDPQFSISNPLIFNNRRSQPLELGGTITLWTALDSRNNSGEELYVKLVSSNIKDCSPNIAKGTPNEGTLLYGYGLIHASIILKSISLLGVLLQAGANPDAMSLCALDDDKVTPLYLAAKLEWVDGLNLLVQYGADVRHALGAGKFKKTAFTIAAELGKLESLRALIIASQQGGWVNVPDGNQITPLHWACWHNHLDCVRLLLGEGRANAEVQDREGLTPLHFAAKRGHADIITCLVQDFRVNPNFTFNKKTGTPLDVAKRGGAQSSKRAEDELRRWGGMTYKDMQKSIRGRR